MDYLTTTFPFSLPLIGVAGIAGKSGQSRFIPFRESRERLRNFNDAKKLFDNLGGTQ